MLGEDFKLFILLPIWSVNDFIPKMTKDIFSRLRPYFQIPDDIPIRMARKNEKCYSGKTTDVGFYEALFIAELRFPLTKLHHQLADYLDVSIY